jgi:hypothetical protein
MQVMPVISRDQSVYFCMLIHIVHACPVDSRCCTCACQYCATAKFADDICPSSFASMYESPEFRLSWVAGLQNVWLVAPPPSGGHLPTLIDLQLVV